MSDINELREKITIKGLDVVADTDILAVLDRLEEAEKERDNANAAAIGVALQAEALQAKISEMERQEPVAWMSSRNGFICKENKNPDYNVPLYALPGAQTQGEGK